MAGQREEFYSLKGARYMCMHMCMHMHMHMHMQMYPTPILTFSCC